MAAPGKSKDKQEAATRQNVMLDLEYRAAMGWDGPPHEDVVKAALERAHQIRQFEIDLSWKRANYFWLLQAAAITGLGVVLSADKDRQLPELLPLALACLGFICAFAGWLSAKGSKFWYQNWEKHIDCLEDAFEGRLHKTVWIGSKGISHSVSRVNTELLSAFASFWALAIIWQGHQNMWNDRCFTCAVGCKFDLLTVFAYLIAGLTLVMTCRLWNQRTDFHKEAHINSWLQREEITGK